MNSVDELRPALSLHSCASAPEIYVCVCVCARARCAIWKVNGRNTYRSHALARPRERDSWSESKLKRASERDTHRIHTAYTHTHTHTNAATETQHTHISTYEGGRVGGGRDIHWMGLRVMPVTFAPSYFRAMCRELHTRKKKGSLSASGDTFIYMTIKTWISWRWKI